MHRTLRLSFVLMLLLTTTAAQGHYLWVIVDAKNGEHGTANVYFEEAPHPGDGGYLDPFITRGKTWIRSLEATDPKPLEVKETKQPKQRWLSATLPDSGTQAVESYGKWGVYRYGQRDILLHYYARFIDAHNLDELKKLARAEHLDLDIVAQQVDGKMELTVLWKGEPAANRDVFLRGPQKFSEKLQTNDKGQVTFEPATKGTYLARTSVEEPDKSGEFEGKAYELTRHNATLTINLPIE